MFDPLNIDLEASHRLIITADGNTYTSEWLAFHSNAYLSEITRIEYWNDSAIKHSRGHLTYANSYRSYFYLDFAIGKPEYPTEYTMQTREGYQYVQRVVNWIEHNMYTYLAEFYLNAIRVVPLHKYIRVHYKGIELKCDRFEINPTWDEFGELADTNIKISSNTVAISYRDSQRDNMFDFSDDFNEDYTI